jgi:hypothetical protein
VFDWSSVFTEGSRIEDCQYPLHRQSPNQENGYVRIALWSQELQDYSIRFPVFILLCIPVRLFPLPRLFDEDELTLLDDSLKNGYSNKTPRQ